jgi:polyhydroxyalkanoate synthesis regulator phasin
MKKQAVKPFPLDLDEMIDRINDDLIKESVRILKLSKSQARKFKQDLLKICAKGAEVRFDENQPYPWLVVYGLGVVSQHATEAEAKRSAKWINKTQTKRPEP